MESMAVITHSSGLPGGRMDVFGDLNFVQKSPLLCTPRKAIRMNRPILLFESPDWLVNIYKEYSKRTRKLFKLLIILSMDLIYLYGLYMYYIFSFY